MTGAETAGGASGMAAAPPRADRMGRRSVPAAALAAAAEAGVVFLPVRLLVAQATGASGGPLASYPVFLLLFTGGVALGTRRQHHPALPTVAAAVGLALGLVQGWRFGAGGPVEIGAAAIVALLVTLRGVTLALRDWRNPTHAAFGWGAGALLVEVILGQSIGTLWRPLLPVVVLAFFVGSLASRALSVRLTEVPEVRGAEDGRGSTSGRLALLGLAALGAPVAGMLVLGGAGGGLELLGRLVVPALGFVITVVAVGFAELARPLLWLAERAHFDVRALQRVLAGLRLGAPKALEDSASRGNPVVARLAGGLLLAAIVGALIVTIRRLRRSDEWSPGPHRDERPETARIVVGARRRRPRTGRGELPADTVRRWYAEALLLLEARGIAKHPSSTPGEYAPAVAVAFPECAHGFHALTRAYEGVRYGRRAVSRAELERLQARWAHVMETVRRSPAVPAEGDAEG